MRIQRINRDDAPHVDIPFTNSQGATITLGFPACFTTTAASNAGVEVVLPAASNFKTFAGIALKDTPNNEIGLARAYGFLNSVRIFATGTSNTVAAGEVLGTNAASNGVNSGGLTFAYGPLLSMEAIGAAVCSPGGYAKAFVRLL